MTKEAVQLPLPGFDQAFGQWRAVYANQIGSQRKVVNRSGIEVRPLYTPRDWDSSAYETDLGFPGQYPFTRGIYPTMHRGRTWTQRQLIGLGTPEDYNARVRQLLAAGATASVSCRATRVSAASTATRSTPPCSAHAAPCRTPSTTWTSP